MIIILFTVLLFGCQSQNLLVKNGCYSYNDEKLENKPTLKLFEKDNQNYFELSPAMKSSTIYNGTYEIKNNQLILHDENKGDIYFQIDDESLSFDEEKSIEIENLKDLSKFTYEE